MNVIKRLWKALFPKKRADAKPTTCTCTECKQQFLGRKGSLTCSKACKRDRRNRILSERWKPVDSPLVNAIHDADPELQITVNEITVS